MRRSQSHAPTKARRHRDGSVWPKRRHWHDRIARDTRLTAGAKSFLSLLGARSDDTGKPVWGAQAKMAVQLARCPRSVRRYVGEAEELGYVKVYRSKPERGPNGRWYRKKTNVYYLCLPKVDDPKPAPRRRQRAPYCVLSQKAQRSGTGAGREHALQMRDAELGSAPGPGVDHFESDEASRQPGLVHLEDSDGPSTPLMGEAKPRCFPTETDISETLDVTSFFAACRAALPPRHSPLGGAGAQRAALSHAGASETGPQREAPVPH